MGLRLTILGCGTSSGVPRIGNDWGQCDPSNPKNRRTRVSILIQSPKTTLLVDTSPDVRQQLLAANIIGIDAVLWTHDHADHSHGIDDLRQIYHYRRHVMKQAAPLDGYARPQTLRLLQRRFSYAFDGGEGYMPIISGQEINTDSLRIGDIDIGCVDMPHGPIWSTGFRFTHDKKSIGYATDFHEITPDMETLFSGVDIWVVDALRTAPHPTHSHLAQTLAGIDKLKPSVSYLTHMDQSMDYDHLCATLPLGVYPAFDGLSVSL